jgi:hypothetical protein
MRLEFARFLLLCRRPVNEFGFLAMRRRHGGSYANQSHRAVPTSRTEVRQPCRECHDDRAKVIVKEAGQNAHNASETTPGWQ